METVRDLAIWYLRNCDLGERRIALFQNTTANGQRTGQAFMNALPFADYAKLTGTLHDPFYRDGNIPKAIDILTTK